ncbi:MAG: ABC transporter permease subunit [Lachnospiraceae bacterium]|nr:ABC transporter permease subunit [Lachnospiraceae bacterium]
MEERNPNSLLNKIKNSKTTFALTLMVLPGLIWLVMLRYVPMFGIVMAFKNYKLPDLTYVRDHGYIADIFARDWIGFQNFQLLFGNPMTSKMIRNTIAYNATFIVLGILISVSFAIILTEISKKFFSRLYQTLMFFPYFISWVVVSYFLMALISTKHGLLDPSWFGIRDFYQQSEPWPFIIIFSNVWKMTGYSTILYLAAITGIDATQYEAASIDGASKWQQVLHVTLPNMRTIIIILFIMNIGRIFNADFGQFWSLPIDGGGGGVSNAVEVIDTFVYRLLRTSVNLGQSTAVSFFQNCIGFICIITANTIVRKVDNDSALF